MLLSDLLVQSGRGDQKAFRRLHDLTRAKLFGICCRVCVDPAAAEDVLAEVYLVIWKRAVSWEPGRASPITWLSIIARNRAIDWRRSNRSTEPLSDAIIASLEDPAPLAIISLEAAQAASRLLQALDVLEPHKRNAIRSAFMDGLSYPELTAKADVPLGTMKSWIRRGLYELRVALERQR